MDNKHIIALEIGSSALKLGLAGQSSGKPTLEALECEAMHGGVRYGRIQNVDEVADALAGVLRKMEARPGFAPAKITGVYAAVGGRSLATVRTNVRLNLPQEDSISRAILDRLEDEAMKAAPEGAQVLQIIPLQFTVDDLPTPNPAGSLGSRIAADYTIVYCDPRTLRNIETVVTQRLGLDICDWVVRPLALAQLCLSNEETKPGCMLADIGAETTTVAIFKDCALQYIATIPLGSQHITSDLSKGLGTTEDEAENIKRRLGNAISDAASMTIEQINIDKYVQARAAEIAANIVAYIGFGGFKNSDLPAGIIITGRGSKLKNFGRMLENQSRMRVRKASPRLDIDIADTSVVESDMLDIIALAAESVKLSQLPDMLPCIQAPEPEVAPQPEVKDDNGTPAEFVIDDKKDEAESEDDGRYTYHPEDGGNYGGGFGSDDDVPGFGGYYNPGDKKEVRSGSDSEDAEDPYLLEDDDTGEKLRARDEERKRREREKAKRQRENEEARKRKELEKQRKAKEKAERPSWWSKRFEDLRNKIDSIIAEPDENDDADDLYSIDKDDN